MGVADYLLSKHEKPKVVIGYDTRKIPPHMRRKQPAPWLPGA